jgi:3-hydroxy-3-methylglutaryl CoA synthase
MVGIVASGVYVPWWRLELQSLGGGQGERAIANFDEDSLTMGVAAAINCLRGIDRGTIDGVFFATTTSPYKEKQASVTIATALDLREDIISADFASSLRAGTTALKAAVDAVKAGTAKKVLVIAADMRPGMPGSDFERLFGDGAVAFVVGADNVKVAIKDSYSTSYEIMDFWRTNEDKYVQTWEDRFIMEEGYLKVLPVAVAALLKKNNLTPKGFSKAVFYAPDGRRHREMAQKLGFDTAQVQNPMFGSLGDTGAAFGLMMLASALEETKPGDKILLASYGSGADAFFLESVGKFDAVRSIKSYLNSKKVLKNYMSYLQWRHVLEKPVNGHARPSYTPAVSAIHREEEKIFRLHGVKCLKCGTVQYPPQHVCINCEAKDQFEKYSFWDKKAELYTFAPDNGIPTFDPPYVLAVVNFAGGGRIWLNMTDKDVDAIKIGMPLELTFRKLATVESIHNYYWKCMPGRM